MSRVVVLIIAHKPDPSPSEINALLQCQRVLGDYPIVMVCPEGLVVSQYRRFLPELRIDFIPAKWQSSYAMFNRLKIEPFLYNRYREFKFILFYELDAWVFRNDLAYWCDQDYDFVGAPWFEAYDEANEKAEFVGVGNGGFSLRKVESHLKALYSFAYIRSPKIVTREFLNDASLKSFGRLFKSLTVSNNTFHLFNDYRFNEDHFWGRVVARKYSWFRVPDLEVASRFSMELNAPFLYERNNRNLPFGCHKWERYHRAFWEQFIETGALPSLVQGNHP